MNDENTKVVDEKVAEEENEKKEIILINEETIRYRVRFILFVVRKLCWMLI